MQPDSVSACFSSVSTVLAWFDIELHRPAALKGYLKGVKALSTPTVDRGAVIPSDWLSKELLTRLHTVTPTLKPKIARVAIAQLTGWRADTIQALLCSDINWK